MASVTKRIGLSLGADLCWPAAFEALIAELDLELPIGDDQVRFEVERVVVEPFDLEAPSKYHLVLDRLTHWFMVSREWIKKIVLLDDVYVLNDPWSIQSMEKHTSYAAMMRLGLPIPKTWMLPPKEYDEGADVKATVCRYNRLFDLAEVGKAVGYPAFLKPYDGGGWVGVTRVTNDAELRAAYDKSGKRVQHLQAAVQGWDVFVRAIGVGPQVNVVRYDPDQPLHDRYRVDFNFVDGAEWKRAAQTCRTINAFFNWDFNSCELLRQAETRVFHPIDFANACPDSQVTSLHFHFPWLVKALVRWSLFNAATARKKPLDTQWQRFYDAHDPALEPDEQLALYDAIALEHFDAEAFEAFCAEHLSELDRIAVEYFASAAFKEVVRLKVSALYPAHEIDRFTDHFYGLIQFWCHTERDRLGL
ncbi:MAG: hypothetical protein ACI8PZ_000848 [Myxococcota bacterium]|jgi:hypothetical protein